MISAVRLQTFTAAMERVVDIAGYIPVVSQTTLVARVGIAAIQMFSAVFCASVIGYENLKSYFSKEKIDVELCDEASRDIAYFSSNAFQNICRGFIEQAPFIGNLICLSWDIIKQRQSDSELIACYGAVEHPIFHRPFIPNITSSN